MRTGDVFRIRPASRTEYSGRHCPPYLSWGKEYKAEVNETGAVEITDDTGVRITVNLNEAGCPHLFWHRWEIVPEGEV